jgi:diguanylate cyclase (GGDEF)-like protein
VKALIYDPKPDTHVRLAKQLKQLGIEALAVTTLKKMLAESRRRRYDLQILDEIALRKATHLERLCSEYPVIIIINRSSRIDYEKMILTGITGFLTRPFRPSLLRRVVKKALNKRQRVLDSMKNVSSLQRKIKELKTLNEVVQAINSSLEPKAIFQTIMDKTADVIKAEAWSVLLLDPKTNELVFEAAAGEAGQKLLGLRIKVGQGVAGWVAQHNKSLVVADVAKDPRFYSGMDKKTKFVTKSILCVPMRHRNQFMGVVEVINKIGGEPFNQDDLEVFENLVAHIAIALENANVYAKMEQTSLTDDLTKLYNIRYGNQFLDTYLSKPTQRQSKLSLIFLDIDYFKLVDDNYGHLVGSETLKLIGDRIRRSIRDKDVAVRYGGDEYMVILPGTDKETAAYIADRIRQEISREPFPAAGKKTFHVSVTLGVATYPDDARNRDELIGAADRAMYNGKTTGRNKVVLA